MNISRLFEDITTEKLNLSVWFNNGHTDAVFKHLLSKTMDDNISQNVNLSELSDDENKNVAEGFNPIIYCTILAVITTVGVVGNIFIIAIFSVKGNRKRSLSVYLQALAVSDSLVLLNTLVDDVIVRLFDQDILYGNKKICSVYIIWNTFWVNFSAGLLVLAALDRYIAVEYPLKRAIICSYKRSIYLTLGTALSCICINLYETVWIEVEIKSRENDVEWEFDCPAMDTYEYTLTNNVLSLVFVLLVPFCVVLVLNVRVLYLVKTSLRVKQDPNSVSLVRVTLPVITVTLSSLFFLFPMLVVEGMEFVTQWISISPELEESIHTAWETVSVILMFNYAINFYILVLFTKNYRDTLRKVCCCPKLYN